MGTAMTPANDQLPLDLKEIFNAALLGGTLTANVTQGFAVISIRGSKWRVKLGGEETPITDEAGNLVPYLDVVLLKGSAAISKTWFEKQYVEGSDASPDCFSMDGVRPDPTAPKRQATACMTCPKNQFGSRINDAGKKAKACSDVRRVAVLPADDLESEAYNGPLLLRVPAMSLVALKEYGKKFEQRGIPYNAVVTRLSFDPDTAYPAIRFKYVRPLTGEEMPIVAKHFVSETTARILEDASVFTESRVQGDVDQDVDPEPEPEPQAKPAAKKQATADDFEMPDLDGMAAGLGVGGIGSAEEEEKPKPARKKRATKKASAKQHQPATAGDDVPQFGAELDGLADSLKGL